MCDVGNPFGMDYTLTAGLISGLGRDVPNGRGRLLRGKTTLDEECGPEVEAETLSLRTGQAIFRLMLPSILAILAGPY